MNTLKKLFKLSCIIPFGMTSIRETRQFFISLPASLFRTKKGGALGFSLTEILISIGILSILAGVGTMFYLNYLDKARLTYLQHKVNAFWKAADMCMIHHYDDFSKCDTLQKLKFHCDDCTGPFRPSVTWVHQKRLSMTFKKGDYQLCVEYASGLPGSADRRVSSIGNHLTGQKFCYYGTGYMGRGRYTKDPKDPKFGTLTGKITHVLGVRSPFEKCSSDSDCKNVGDKCQGKKTWGAMSLNVMKCK